MPFITEEIWQALSNFEKPLMIESFPVYDEKLNFKQEEADFEKIISAIKAIRNRRAEMNVVPSVKAKLFVETNEIELFDSGKMFFERLAFASSVECCEKFEIEDCVTVVTDSARIFIPLNDLVDTEKEIARLNKEKAVVQKDIDFLSSKLNNEGFLSKAPQKLIDAENQKLDKANEKMLKIEESILALTK